MNHLSVEKACFIIVKAREYHAKTEPDDLEAGSNAADDKMVEILEDNPDDPTFEELVGAVESLNDEERAELLALFWLGRGDFEKMNWRSGLKQAAEFDGKQAARYIVSHPMASDHIESGLEAFGQSCEAFEIERL
jgi:hypothetical protein